MYMQWQTEVSFEQIINLQTMAECILPYLQRAQLVIIIMTEQTYSLMRALFGNSH